MRSEAFPTGVVIFFRQMADDKTFARSVHPAGRNVSVGRHGAVPSHDDDYVVLDGNGNFLGCYPRDFVAAILPLETTGPGTAPNANNPPLNS